jgi:hypothetical protein
VSDPKLSPVDMSNLLDKKVSAPLLQFFSAEATMSFVVAVMSFS